jgi:GNAT superfamily N-acetyltransferase
MPSVSEVDGRLMRIYDDECEPAGMAFRTWTDTGWMLSHLYVQPEHRRKGYATRLVRELLALSHDWAKVLPQAWADEPMSTEQLVAWFKRLGFRHIPSTRDVAEMLHYRGAWRCQER